MMVRGRQRHLLCGMFVGLIVALAAPAGTLGATLHTRQLATASYGGTPVGFARTGDGVLHLVVEQNTNWGDSYNGIGAISISPTGHIGPPVQALNWGGQSAQGIPGLTVLSSGALQATWGGFPFGPDGPWGITSSNGGASWSAPVDVGSGSMAFGDSHVAVAMSNGTPVMAAGCCGNIVIQTGFGPGSPTYQLTNSTDGCAGNQDLATDAASGAVVAAWQSCDGTGGQWLQQVAPSEGSAVKLPVPTQYGSGVTAIVAGRGAGSGVFAAYPANWANTSHIDLYRYGGGSVSVGSARHMHADVWGVATGSHGRIWVMWWGQNTKTGRFQIAATRSNNAISAFEPIQVFGLSYSSLFTLQGDGSLGPLDLLIGGNPNGSQAASGIYFARIIPELSATVRVVNLGGGKFRLKAHVTDAGDPVKGATVSAKGIHKKTNAHGRAKLTVSGIAGRRVTVTISGLGYRTLKVPVIL